MEAKETIPPSETPGNPPFDAVFVHSYWLSKDKNQNSSNYRNTRLALRSRLATRAAALFYNSGKGARNIVLAGGNFWGYNNPAIAQLMKEELIQDYGVPKEAITIAGEKYSTGGETEAFAQIATDQGWTSLADIGFKRHRGSISSSLKESGVDADFMSAEDILRQYDKNPHVKHLLNKLGKSKYEFVFRFIYKPGKKIARKLFRRSTKKMEQRNKTDRTIKGVKRDFGIRRVDLPLDVYNK